MEAMEIKMVHSQILVLIITKFTMILKKHWICLTKDGHQTLFQKINRSHALKINEIELHLSPKTLGN